MEPPFPSAGTPAPGTPPRRIAILGTGLIGASIGLAVRRAFTGVRVAGYDRSPQTTAIAQSVGALDEAADSAAEAVCAVDLVVLAPPVLAIPDLLRAITPALAPGTLVTDVGSTKRQVVAWARELLPPGIAFVGSHPMAGRVAVGPADADADLFQGAVWCIARDAATPAAPAEWLAWLVGQMGAQPLFVDPAEHDALVAQVSHLPYLLAAGLMRFAADQPTWPQAARVAATGFAYATNLAGKDPRMYADIMRSNRAAVVEQLDGLIGTLQSLRASIAEDDPALEALFQQAQRQHQGWLAEHPAVQRAMQPPARRLDD